MLGIAMTGNLFDVKGVVRRPPAFSLLPFFLIGYVIGRALTEAI
jgi:hypothetical protein